jgi:hypothetical protein
MNRKRERQYIIIIEKEILYKIVKERNRE